MNTIFIENIINFFINYYKDTIMILYIIINLIIYIYNKRNVYYSIEFH